MTGHGPPKTAEQRKNARLRRLRAEDGESDFVEKSSNSKDEYSTVGKDLQEEVAGKYTQKRRKAIEAARIMRGVADDILETVEIDVPMRHEFYYPAGYHHMVGRVIEPAHHETHEVPKAGPRTSKWWRASAKTTGDCGSKLEFYVQRDAYKLHKANFCRSRYCPYCNWRRSLKIYGQMSEVMDWLSAQSETKNYRYIFLTLTVRNCTADQLSSTVTRMAKAWAAIVCGGIVPAKAKSHAYSWLPAHVIRGTFRALEVTVNQEAGTYHPHYHVVIAVPYNYFWRSNPWYLSQADWCTIWQCAMALDYTPLVSVEGVKRDLETGYRDAVAEVSKYPIKDSDWMGLDIPYDKSKEYLYALANGLYNRRLLSWSGCFHDARRALGLQDPEDGDLADDETVTLRDDVETLVRAYYWRAGVTGSYVRDWAAETQARIEAGFGSGIAVSADDFDDGDGG